MPEKQREAGANEPDPLITEPRESGREEEGITTDPETPPAERVERKMPRPKR